MAVCRLLSDVRRRNEYNNGGEDVSRSFVKRSFQVSLHLVVMVCNCMKMSVGAAPSFLFDESGQRDSCPSLLWEEMEQLFPISCVVINSL